MNELTEREKAHEEEALKILKEIPFLNTVAIRKGFNGAWDLQQSKIDELKATNEQLVRECDALNKLREERVNELQEQIDELVKALEYAIKEMDNHPDYSCISEGSIAPLRQALEKHKKYKEGGE